ncbi:MAG: hypothetical protein V9E82_15045 [Candidatus Nanopelagicales bacterium]
MTAGQTLTRAAIAAVAAAVALAALPLSPAGAAPASAATVMVAAKPDRGSLRVVAQGVPQGRQAKITVARKDFRKKLRSAGTLRNLKPGTYRVWASPIVADGGTAAVPNLPLRVKVPKKRPATLSMQYQWSPKTDVYAPGPVTGLSVSGFGASSVSLQWVNSVAPDLQGVAIRRKQGPVAPVALDDGQVVQVGAGDESATDTGLAQFTTYSYSVFMVDTAGNASPPATVSATTTGQAAEVTAGTQHTCAQLPDSVDPEQGGQVACWGTNAAGQLGDGTSTMAWEPRLVPLTQVMQIVAGADHTCARLRDGSVWCWGRNDHGQLGDGTTVNAPVPVKVALSVPVMSIAAGGDHTCAVATNGGLRCWGDNEFGQLGARPSPAVTTPPTTAIATTVTAVTAGWSHTCYLRGGAVRCFGANGDGQLGNGSTQNSQQAVLVPELTKVTQVAAGVGHTCAVVSDKTLHCWGANDEGQIGDGTKITRLSPVLVSGAFTEVAAGAYHTCGITDPNQLRCWGRNGTGRLGDGTTADRLLPTRVALSAAVSSLAAGGYHTCAVAGTKTLCWGFNGLGQLGNPTVTSSLDPRAVRGL